MQTDTMKHSILLIDDHILLRQSLVQTLKNISDYEIFDAGNKEDSITIIKGNPQIELLLLDLDVGNEDGLDILNEIRKINSNIKALILSMHSEPLRIQEACCFNIQGYIQKDSDLQTLKSAINTVLNGELYFTGTALKVLQKGFLAQTQNGSGEIFTLYQTLSKKEQEIFVLFARGLSSKEVASELEKSVKTVDNQKTAVYQKLGISDIESLKNAAKTLGIR